MVDENVAKREVETMEWSADVGAGSQATTVQQQRCNVGHRRLMGRKVPD